MTGSRTDAYLDQLLFELRGRTADVRRVLAEAEEHLRDATAEGVSSGLSPEEAERQAIERFGAPRAVARRFSAPAGRLPVPALREMASAFVLLLGIGLVAIGVSGLLAAGFRTTLGARFVAADPPGLTYTPTRCGDFFDYHPEATTCEAAAAAHHADEVESYRMAAGVAGGLVLGARWLGRRWVGRRPHPSDLTIGWLPEELVPVVGMVVFAIAGAALGMESLNALTQDARQGGAGQWLSALLVSVVMAAWFGRSLLRALRLRTAIAAESG